MVDVAVRREGKNAKGIELDCAEGCVVCFIRAHCLALIRVRYVFETGAVVEIGEVYCVEVSLVGRLEAGFQLKWRNQSLFVFVAIYRDALLGCIEVVFDGFQRSCLIACLQPAAVKLALSLLLSFHRRRKLLHDVFLDCSCPGSKVIVWLLTCQVAQGLPVRHLARLHF